MEPPPLITAVICTYNRAPFLRKCVESLLSQTLDRGQYEILIVNNGSTDDTEQVIASLAGERNVRSVNEPVCGLSRARNTGYRAARGEYVGYIDDDATADPRWLESALHSFGSASPAPVWVGGPISLEWETCAPAWMNDELSVPLGWLFLGETPRWLGAQERLGGGNSFFRKATLADMGGFDEKLGRKPSGLLSGEETELQQRVQARGERLYYHPGVAIRHFVPAARTRPGWFYRRYYWGGISDAVMAGVLAGKQVASNSFGGDVGGTDSGGSRLWRMLRNVGFALGLGGRVRMVRARIYLSYVCGRIVGTLGLQGRAESS